MIHFTWVTGFGTTMICCVRRQGKVSSSRYTKPELSNQKKNMGGGFFKVQEVEPVQQVEASNATLTA